MCLQNSSRSCPAGKLAVPVGTRRRPRGTVAAAAISSVAGLRSGLVALASEGVAVWMNGDLFPDNEAKISVFDHGLVVGDGVFETIKVTDGVPFALTRHLKRLDRKSVV